MGRNAAPAIQAAKLRIWGRCAPLSRHKAAPTAIGVSQSRGGALIRQPRLTQAKKTRVLGEESGLRPLGVKQRYAVPEHLYRRATWGGCAAPTLQVLARFGAVPVHIGRFLNRFGIRQRFIPPATHGRKHRETQTCVDDPCNFPQVRHNKPLRLSSSPSHAERTS